MRFLTQKQTVKENESLEVCFRIVFLTYDNIAIIIAIRKYWRITDNLYKV